MTGAVVVWPTLLSSPAQAAETIIFRYGFLERSLPVQDLATFVETGRVSAELGAYLRLLPLERREQLRSALQERLRLSPVAVAQLLYSPLGQELLEQAAGIIQTQSRRSNALALRSALIAAASDPNGLTVLGLIHHYPSASIRIDLQKGLTILKNFQATIRETETILEVVRQHAAPDMWQEDVSAVQSLLQPGAGRWLEMPWVIEDRSLRRLQLTGHPRTIEVDIYLPLVSHQQPVPVVVISHGLGANRHSYRYLSQHLASHGFAVIALEHAGSSTRQLLSFPVGYTSAYTAAQEFLDRPLDVTFVLNHLSEFPEQLHPWQGRLNLEAIAMIGQSFGGYTALALAGAQLDFEQLARHCPSSILESFNVSLLLQCQAKTLPPRTYYLQDQRVKAVLVVNPITSALFSPRSLAQLTIPVMFVAGSNDTIAPAVSEQIYPFTWLTTPDRYLALIDEATHFSTIGEAQGNEPVMPIPTRLVGATPPRSRAYLRALSLAFLRAHLLEDTTARRWLTPAAAAALSRPPDSLNLTRSLATPMLDTALDQLAVTRRDR
ncbi:alpha/beta fold hydrolase [Thermosynechococcaceae cyanobacterium Okahandja]